MTRGNPDRAPDLVRRYGCGGCHSIAGVPGADGKVGPALEGLRARVFIAGRVRNSADDLIGWIVAPQDYARVPRCLSQESAIEKRETLRRFSMLH